MRAEGEVVRFPTELVEARARFDEFVEDEHDRLYKALYFVTGSREGGFFLMIGRRPYAAFGNSTGDRQMLEYTGAGDGATCSRVNCARSSQARPDVRRAIQQPLPGFTAAVMAALA